MAALGCRMAGYRTQPRRVTGHKGTASSDIDTRQPRQVTGHRLSLYLALLLPGHYLNVWPSGSDSLLDGDDTTLNLIQAADISHCVSAYLSHGPPMTSVSSQNHRLLQDAHNARQRTCAECDQIFSQSQLLEDHAQEEHHRAYRCTKDIDCGKTFKLRSSWSRHERSHSAQKNHACSQCKMLFHRKDNLRDHVRTCKLAPKQAGTPLESLATFLATSHGAGNIASTEPPADPSLPDHGNTHHNTEARHEALRTANLADDNRNPRAGKNLLEDPVLTDGIVFPTLWGDDGIIEDLPMEWPLSDFCSSGTAGGLGIVSAGGLGIMSAGAAVGAFCLAAASVTGFRALGLTAIPAGLSLLGSASFSRQRRLRQDQASRDKTRPDFSAHKA
jgi:hypothetical protein